jgi:hypothetical protein
MGSIAGDRAQVQEGLASYAEIGVGRFVLMVGTITPENYKQRLERYASTYL